MTLFTTVDPRPIHFMGIAGAGMSGLALLAKEQAVAITGCDNDPTGAADLAANGVEIWRGHDPGHVAGARAVVVTAAVPGDHPELKRARALGVPVVRRADALSQAVAGGTVVAVAGTHGKTTTTVMVTEALAAAGRDPTVLAGGRVARWGGNARMGGRDLYVVEADEYDRAFLSLAPAVAVVHELGADLERALAALAEFTGVGRRFERVGEAGGVMVVDDYAHHPTEVQATLAAARQAFPRRRVVAVFQPHLFSRTALHGDALGRALAAADVVVVAPIYGAREQPLPGVSAALVARGAVRAGATTVALRERATLTERVAETVQAGDVVFTLGAGDITRVGPELLARLGTGAGAGAGAGACRDAGRVGGSGRCWASRGRGCSSCPGSARRSCCGGLRCFGCARSSSWACAISRRTP